MVQAIPDGVSSVVPYLCIRGANKAIEFYQAAFDAEVMSVMPMGDLVAHADLKIGGARVYLADEMPGFGAVKSPKALKGTSASLHLWSEDCDAAFAKAVAAGAKVLMPLTDQFWGDRFGMVGDPFGHVWGISSQKEELTPAEIAKRGEAAMAQMAEAAPSPKVKPRPRSKKRNKGLPKPEAAAAPASPSKPAKKQKAAKKSKPSGKDKPAKGKAGKGKNKAKKSKKDKKRKKKSKR